MNATGGRAGQQFAVVFREHGRPAVAGSLEVTQDGLILAGGAGRSTSTLEIPLADIAEIHVGHRPADRINGYRTLILERGRQQQQPAVEVAPVQAGLLHEIADLLALLTSGEAGTGETLAVIVPLKPGCTERARRLLAEGPPLDPAALGLTGHHVFLHGQEAVFLFEGSDVEARVGRAMRSPALWRAGIAWQHCIAGRPRIDRQPQDPVAGETPAYTWTAPQ